jgi:hypothetical protein
MGGSAASDASGRNAAVKTMIRQIFVKVLNITSLLHVLIFSLREIAVPFNLKLIIMGFDVNEELSMPCNSDTGLQTLDGRCSSVRGLAVYLQALPFGCLAIQKVWPGRVIAQTGLLIICKRF